MPHQKSHVWGVDCKAASADLQLELSNNICCGKALHNCTNAFSFAKAGSIRSEIHVCRGYKAGRKQLIMGVAHMQIFPRGHGWPHGTMRGALYVS